MISGSWGDRNFCLDHKPLVIYVGDVMAGEVRILLVFQLALGFSGVVEGQGSLETISYQTMFLSCAQQAQVSVTQDH